MENNPKSSYLSLIRKNKMSIVFEKNSKMVSATNVTGSLGESGGAEPPGRKSRIFSLLRRLTRIFHARRRRGTPRASDASCVSAVERPRERLPCRPPGRLRAGAPLQPASWPYRLSSLLSKLFPFIRAAAVGRSRPAESSTSLFDRLGVTSSTGTSQVSSAQRIPRRAAALLEKIAAFSCGFYRSALFSFHGGAEHPPACADAGQ